MKKLVYITTATLVLVSSISAVLAIVSTSSAAYAGETSDSAYCQKAFKPATSGGAVRERLTAMAKCNSTNTISNTSAVQPLKSSLTTNSTNASNVCVIPPAGTTGGSIRQNFEASTRCNSGR